MKINLSEDWQALLIGITLYLLFKRINFWLKKKKDRRIKERRLNKFERHTVVHYLNQVEEKLLDQGCEKGQEEILSENLIVIDNIKRKLTE